MFKFKSRLWKVNQTKGDSKVWFSGRPVDRGVSVTQPPVDQLTQNFACEDLLGGKFEFCSSQDHHMQNFRLIGPFGAELQTPPVQ